MIPKLNAIIDVRMWSPSRGIHWITCELIGKERTKECGLRFRLRQKPYIAGERDFWIMGSSEGVDWRHREVTPQ